VKTRLVSLCLCLGFMPFVVGCVEDAKADYANKPDEKAKADSTVPDAAKKAKKTPLEFSELPANDPLVANAIEAREQIAELELELLQQLDELRSALTSVKADPERLRDSALPFLEITKAMRQKTLHASEAISALSEKTAELSRSSRHLASSYRALAGLFRQKARDYSEKKLREQLLGFAKDYDDVAASIPERCKSLDAIQKKLPSLKRKVKEVHSFLNDVVSFLNTHPGIGADPREKYSAEFESFAVTFSEWIRVLDDLRSALRERAVSKVIQESYRREVVAFEKLEVVKREEQTRVERAKQEEIAKAEQAKRDEESRLAKLAAIEEEKLALKRERTAKAEVISSPPVPTSVVMTVRYSEPVTYYSQSCPQPVRYSQPVTYCSHPCPQPCVCQPVQPCRVRLFALFRRG